MDDRNIQMPSFLPRQCLIFVVLVISALMPRLCGAEVRAQASDAVKVGWPVGWDKIFHDRVNAHWSADGNAFWFRSHEPDETWHYYWVDATAASKQLAFDHRQLANLLGRAQGEVLDPAKLPVDDIDIAVGRDGARSLIIDAEGKRWTFDAAKNTIAHLPGASVGAESLPRVPDSTASPFYSSNTPTEVMSFINNLKTPIRIVGVNSYAEVNHSETLPDDSNVTELSYQGEVWHLFDMNGQSLGTYVTPVGGGTVNVNKEAAILRTLSHPQLKAPAAVRAFNSIRLA
jgi:hypothetical protein